MRRHASNHQFRDFLTVWSTVSLENAQATSFCQKMCVIYGASKMVQRNFGQWRVSVRCTKHGSCKEYECTNINSRVISVHSLLSMYEQHYPGLSLTISCTHRHFGKAYAHGDSEIKCTSTYFGTKAILGHWAQRCSSKDTRQPAEFGRTNNPWR